MNANSNVLRSPCAPNLPPNTVGFYNDGPDWPTTPVLMEAERAYRDAFLVAAREVAGWDTPDLTSIDEAWTARRTDGLSATATVVAGQTTRRTGGHPRPAAQRIHRRLDRRGHVQGQGRRSEGPGRDARRITGLGGRHRRGVHRNGPATLRLEPKGGGAVARFKQCRSTGDPGCGLFEPYFERRKSGHRKEKAV